ncbi:iron transporter [Marinomonas sp. TI.3.20]|uniref:iron transporter n=1 Tax=Marinomonas sp. TI.3.20 TaxID=3121296 RepID=UPI00311E3CAB
MRSIVFFLALSFITMSHQVQAQEREGNTLLGSIDKDGMNLSSGIRLEGENLVLWSRPKANAYNPNGYVTNDFISFCKVSYTLQKLDDHWQKTIISPMRLTQTGPEYGQVMMLDGAGQYRWRIQYQPPIENGFFRHIDKATGVAPWWKPFVLTYTFTLDAKGQIHKGVSS